MMVNMNIRVLGNDHIYVDYQMDGKRFTAGFSTWDDYIEWLSEMVKEQNTDEINNA